MSPSLTIPTAFFFYLDNLLVTVSGSYSSSCLLFRPILLALDILDLPSCFYTVSVFVGTNTNSTISYLVLLGHVFGYTFCPFAAIFWIFKIQLRAEDYLGSFPHQLLLFTLVPCWNVHSSSFCTEGSWQFPFIVLSGLKAPTFFWKTIVCKKMCSVVGPQVLVSF